MTQKGAVRPGHSWKEGQPYGPHKEQTIRTREMNFNLDNSNFHSSKRVDPQVPMTPWKESEPQRINERNGMKRAGEAVNCPTWPPLYKIPLSYEQIKGQN